MHRLLSYVRRKLVRLVMRYRDYRMEQRITAMQAEYGDAPLPQEKLAEAMLEDTDSEAMACTIKITSALIECARWYGDEDLALTWRFGKLWGKVIRIEHLTPEESILFNRMWYSTTPNATMHDILVEDGDILPHATRFIENGIRGEEFKAWLARVRVTTRDNNRKEH